MFLVTSQAVRTIGGRVRCIVPIPLLAREPSFLAAATASAAGAEVSARRATPNLGPFVPDRVDSGYLRSVLLNDRWQAEGGPSRGRRV